MAVNIEGNGPEAGLRYFLKREGGTPWTRLEFDSPPESVSGNTVIVRGYDQDGIFHVREYELEATQPEVARASQPLTGQSLVKSRTVAFAIVNYFDRGVTTGTATAAASYMYSTTNAGPNLGIDTGDKSVRQYYDEVSYGMFRMSEGSGKGVEGPFSYSGGAACGDSNCDVLAEALTPKLSATYDHHIWFYGTVLPECNGGYGWGSQGTWNSPQGDIWFNGEVFDGAITHEIGHNLGFQHASSIACSGTPLADDPTTCTTTEYGNTVSIMGNMGNGHMSGLEKWYAGWLLGCNGVRVRASGTFTLFPIEIPCNGIQTLQIPMPKTTRKFKTDQSGGSNPAKFYYLELRTSQGLDTGQKNQIMVHVSDDVQPPSAWCARNILLDMKPSTTNTIDGMVAGDTFTDPAGGVTFKIDSLSSSQATVTVTLSTSSGSNTCIDNTTLVGSGPSSCTGSGGGTSSGGTTGTGGVSSGGATAAGGRANVGGATSAAGAANGGGIATLGGNGNSGGSTAIGGRMNAGGSPSSGGRTNAGGASGSGGASLGGSASGGRSNAGGSTSSTSVPIGSGGTVANGGTSAASGGGPNGNGGQVLGVGGSTVTGSTSGGNLGSGTVPTGNAGTGTPALDGGDESGCSCSLPARTTSTNRALLGAILLGLLWRRDHRARSRATLG